MASASTPWRSTPRSTARLSGIREGVARFYEGIQPLVAGGRLGAVLWQLPETFRHPEQWARRLHEWRRERELFVYFNNDWEAFAPRDALLLRRELRRLAGEVGDERSADAALA